MDVAGWVVMDAEQIRAWKEAALRPDLDAPVPTHKVDQILAAARDAGLTEREQGVLILTMTMGDLERKLTAAGKQQMHLAKKLAMAGAMSMRLLRNV
jgi:hypothetical protein